MSTPAASLSESMTSMFETPGKFGTLCSFTVLLATMITVMILDAYVADNITYSYWTDGCPEGKEDTCRQNGLIYRSSFALVILFGIQFIGTFVSTRFYDEYWGLKILTFGAFFTLFVFLPANVFDTHGYAWFARVAAFIFLILQQVILIDMAYLWNEKWVEYSKEEGAEDGDALGSKWLFGLILISFLFYAASWSAIGVMFWQFDQCANNTVILSLTVIFTTVITIFQVGFSSEGSLITSAVMTAYATYICFAALILNPNSYCNPTIGTGSQGDGYRELSEAIGMCITIVSLAWTSYTMISEVPSSLNATNTNYKGPNLTNLLTGGTGEDQNRGDKDADAASAGGGLAITTPTASTGAGSRSNNPYIGLNTLFLQISFIFVLIAAYFAMVLTNWATVDGVGENKKQGFTAMWLQATAQWIALLLYGWSLVAPQILTDREFGR